MSSANNLQASISVTNSQRRALGNVKNVVASTPLAAANRDQLKRPMATASATATYKNREGYVEEGLWKTPAAGGAFRKAPLFEVCCDKTPSKRAGKAGSRRPEWSPPPTPQPTPAPKKLEESKSKSRDSAVRASERGRAMSAYFSAKSIQEGKAGEESFVLSRHIETDMTISPQSKATFEAIINDEKENQESAIPLDHTERDMMCTYLPLRDTYDGLIRDGPPDCMCELYDDFTNSFSSELKYNPFDELDNPKFRWLWSEDRVAAYDASMLALDDGGEGSK